MMIDVSDLLTDPDFAFPYIVLRTSGHWKKGRFITDKPKRLKYYGSVQPATVKEIEQLSIGDQQKGIMKFMCKMPKELYHTRNLAEEGAQKDGASSDEIEWRGSVYKIIQVMPWNHYGWLRAFGCLKE